MKNTNAGALLNRRNSSNQRLNSYIAYVELN